MDKVVLGVSGNELNRSIDSTRVMPTGGRFFGIVDVNLDEVGAFFEMLREVVVKGDVAVGSVAEFVAIDGNSGIAIDPVEVNGDLFSHEAIRELKSLLIPADAANAKTAITILSSAFTRTHFP